MPRLRPFVGASAFLTPVLAGAQTPTGATTVAGPELLGGAYLLQVLGSLIVVFVCLFAVLYAMRRLNRIGGPGAVPLRVLGSASVGGREKVVLMEAGDKQLLLGVSPGSVRTLHCFDEPLTAVQEEPGATPSFAEALRAAAGVGQKQ